MSLDKLLLNLKVIGCIPPHGRIRRAQSGLIAIEETSVYASLKRFLFKEGRRSTVDDINQIILSAVEKSHDVLTSKYLEDEQQGFSQDIKFSEERQKIIDIILQLESDLDKALTGIENLKMTYHDDLMIVCELNIILNRTHVLITRLRQFLSRSKAFGKSDRLFSGDQRNELG